MTGNEIRLAQYVQQTEAALEAALPKEGGTLVREAMRYSLLGGGKRIRAALVLEFARLGGAAEQQALPLACAVEMIHAYSLIHDDLPCMDNDDFRRGKPSCHKKFGEACALLAGDGLLTLAFETAAGAPLLGEAKARSIAELAKAAGWQGMIGGQMMDLDAENHPVSMETLQKLYAMKTGELLKVSALLGCIAADAPEIEAVAQNYTSAIGMAFQITDDILDVTGSTEKLGKPVGSDKENGKSTYVSLLGLESAKKEACHQIQLARIQAEKLTDPGFLIWLADLILNRDH